MSLPPSTPAPDVTAYSLETGWYYEANCRKCGGELTVRRAMYEQPCYNCGFRYHRANPRFISFDYP